MSAATCREEQVAEVEEDNSLYISTIFFYYYHYKTLVLEGTIITSVVVCQLWRVKRDNVVGRRKKWRFSEQENTGNKGNIRQCELTDNNQAISNGLQYKVRKKNQSLKQGPLFIPPT